MVVTIGQFAVLPITVALAHRGGERLARPLISRTPEQVWDYLVEGWRSGEIVDNLAATMEAVVIAFVLASVVGVVAGIALALLPRTERIFNPYLDALNATPPRGQRRQRALRGLDQVELADAADLLAVAAVPGHAPARCPCPYAGAGRPSVDVLERELQRVITMGGSQGV